MATPPPARYSVQIYTKEPFLFTMNMDGDVLDVRENPESDVRYERVFTTTMDAFRYLSDTYDITSIFQNQVYYLSNGERAVIVQLNEKGLYSLVA